MIKNFILALEDSEAEASSESSDSEEKEVEDKNKNNNKVKIAVTQEPEGILKNIFIEKNLKIWDLWREVGRTFRISPWVIIGINVPHNPNDYIWEWSDMFSQGFLF